jgi:hypothetical protein
MKKNKINKETPNRIIFLGRVEEGGGGGGGGGLFWKRKKYGTISIHHLFIDIYVLFF